MGTAINFNSIHDSRARIAANNAIAATPARGAGAVAQPDPWQHLPSWQRLAALLTQLPDAPVPRPPQSAASLPQASQRLDGFVRDAGAVPFKGEVDNQLYQRLQAMNRRVHDHLSQQGQMRSNAPQLRLVSSSKAAPAAATAPAAPSATAQPSAPISPKAPSVSPSTPVAQPPAKAKPDGAQDQPAPTASAKPPTQDAPPAATSTTPSAPTSTPTSTTPPASSTTPSVGPRSLNDDFGTGLGAGMGHSSNMSNSPEVVLAINNIINGSQGADGRNKNGGFGGIFDGFSFGQPMSLQNLQSELKDKYGIESNIENMGGRQVLRFANGDYFCDGNGNGMLDGMDYKFNGAVDAIKEKYGLDPAQFQGADGMLELGRLAEERMDAQVAQADWFNGDQAQTGRQPGARFHEQLFGQAFNLADA